jgi:hypothetical protein
MGIREENREVLDAVRIRRDDLYEAILGLERALAVPAGDAPDAWGEVLAAPIARLVEVLDAHVDGTEGPGGLFDQIRDDAPHLLSVVERLRAEHDPLEVAASTLSAHAAAVTTDAEVDDVRDEALDLVRRLLEHRHHGAELLFDAYHVDVSSGD